MLRLQLVSSRAAASGNDSHLEVVYAFDDIYFHGVATTSRRPFDETPSTHRHAGSLRGPVDLDDELHQ